MYSVCFNVCYVGWFGGVSLPGSKRGTNRRERIREKDSDINTVSSKTQWYGAVTKVLCNTVSRLFWNARASSLLRPNSPYIYSIVPVLDYSDDHSPVTASFVYINSLNRLIDIPV